MPQPAEGLNVVAWTRIAALCRALEMTPNELFGLGGKMVDDVPHLGTWGIKIGR